ncbi:sodium-dependent transporter [Caldithrix abyssi]
MAKSKDFFTSRYGLIAATIGMAVGAGNIWRFPRLAGQYGGSFLIPWLLFLFLWSIPLLIVEFGVGKKTRKGTIGAFSKINKRFTWLGWFVGFCTTAILFYYSVVCGWSLKYFLLAVRGKIFTINHEQMWQSFTHFNPEALLYHFAAIALGVFIIYRGIVRGVERFSKIIVPLLFVLLLLAAVRAITLPNAEIGLHYFFRIEMHQFLNYRLWLDALSQSAWSTGAGWGLLLTYAIYARNQENIVSNSFLTGIGNNLASILAGLAIIPTVFALSANLDQAHEVLGAGNQGLAFIALPQLFEKMPAGLFFVSVFFLSLFFAALSSLISMIELATRVLMDFGLKRKRAVLSIGLATFLFGAPSALSLEFFNNQDWVWGLGLLLSGLFFAFVVNWIGVETFLSEWVNLDLKRRGLKIGGTILFKFLIPLQFVAMLGWWFWQAIQWNPETWWHPLRTYSLGTTLLQWMAVIAAGLWATKHFVRWLAAVKETE